MTARRQVDLPGQQRPGSTYLSFFGQLSAFLTLRQMQLQPLRGLPPAIQTLSGMQDLRTHESCSTCARVRCSKRLRRKTFSSSTLHHCTSALRFCPVRQEYALAPISYFVTSDRTDTLSIHLYFLTVNIHSAFTMLNFSGAQGAAAA